MYFWSLNFISLIYMPILISGSCCFDYCNFVVSFEGKKWDFFLALLLADWCLLQFLMNVQIGFSLSAKTVGIWTGVCFEFVGNLDSIDFLATWTLPIHESRMFLLYLDLYLFFFFLSNVWKFPVNKSFTSLV
jgi:hypothetical protein